jgi:hypothetical protein
MELNAEYLARKQPASFAEKKGFSLSLAHQSSVDLQKISFISNRSKLIIINKQV